MSLRFAHLNRTFERGLGNYVYRGTERMDLGALTDAALVALAAAGGKEAFGELIKRYQDAVFGLAYSHTASFADAEDIAQEVFLAAWEALGKLRDGSRFGPWLHGITLNKVRMHLRTRKRDLRRREKHALMQRPGMAERSPDSEHRGADALTRELGRLTPARRVTATLYYIDGYSYKQVSSFLGVPLGTVKRRLFEARQRLKERLAMVEKKLKAERPKSSFTRRVLERIDSVKVAVAGEHVSAVLLTDEKRRSFLIYIGPPEARSINMALEGSKFPRPMTHDLFVNTIKQLGGRIVELVVSALKEETYYGTLVIRLGQRRHEIDCRPSDGIAIALRARAPIYVHKSVANQVVMKRKDGKPLSPRSAQRYLKKMAERPKKMEAEIAQLRAELAKHPRSLEAKLRLAAKLRGTDWEEAKETLERALRAARGRKQKAKVHVALATCWYFKNRLEEAEKHLDEARNLSPGWQKFMDVRVDAYIEAMRLFDQWARTGKTDVFDKALQRYETFLKTRVGGPGTPLATFRNAETGRKLQEQKRYRDLMSQCGIFVSVTPHGKPPRRKRKER